MTNKRGAEFLPASREPETEVFYGLPDMDEETITAADAAAAAAVEQLSSNAEKGKVIRIYRQLGTGQETMEFVAKYPADKYSIDDLIEKMQVEYGGGDYRFMIYNEKGKLAANKLISIARKQKVETGENAGLYGVLDSLMNKQDQFMRLFLTQKPDEGDSRQKMLQELVIMKQLFSPGDNKSGDTISQIKELMEAMAMIKDMGSPPEDNDGFAGIFKSAMPLLQTIAENSATAPPMNRHPYRRQQAPGRANTMQTMAVKQLLTMCEQGKEPQEVAAKINEQLLDEFIPEIEALILGNNALDKIAAINPRVLHHGEWFGDVIEWLKGFLGHPCKFDAEFDEEQTGDNNLTPDNDSDTIAQDEDAAIDANGDTLG